MTNGTAQAIKQMIEDECTRDSLQELCDNWGITTEDFWEFLDLAVEKASENEQKQKEDNK